MIIVYEPFCTGFNHVPINSDLILIIAEKFSNEEITVIGEENHLKSIKEKIGNVNLLIHYKSIPIIEPRNGKLQSLINEKHNIRNILKIYKFKMKMFFVLNSHPHTMFFIKKYIPESIPVIFLIHGNLEELKRKKRINQLGYWIEPAFKYRKDRANMKYLVLGESIRSNVLKYLSFIESKLIAIPHPYNMYHDVLNCKIKSDKIVFGMIGSFSPEKRSELIFTLEQHIRERGMTNCEFLLVGADDKYGFPNSKYISIIGDGKSKLTDSEYNEGIERLDYVLFFWPADSYQMTASGAIHDAIAHRKPIIAIRNEYLTWVFNKVGELGFLCDNFEELEEVVTNAAMGKLKDKSSIFEKNYEKAENFFSKSNVRKLLDDNDVWMM